VKVTVEEWSGPASRLRCGAAKPVCHIPNRDGPMPRDVEDDRRLAALMEKVQGGSKAAYRHLLSEVTPLVRRTIRRRRPFLQPEDIEDLVQDILLSLHAARATYDPTRPFLPWLMAIAHNRMTDGARRYARRAGNEVAVEHYPETFSATRANMFDETYGDPEALRAAIRALPKGQREAVEMLKLRELSLKEASALGGTSIAALKVAVHRGIKALRTAMTKDFSR